MTTTRVGEPVNKPGISVDMVTVIKVGQHLTQIVHLILDTEGGGLGELSQPNFQSISVIQLLEMPFVIICISSVQMSGYNSKLVNINALVIF